MKKTITTLILLLLGILLIAFLTQSTVIDENNPQLNFKITSHTFAAPLPAGIDFAGEDAPLNMYDVRERLDREINVNTYWQSQTIFYLKRASRWFPVIESILKQNGVPDDFKYVAVAESGLINSISNMQAVGFWQFLEGTGKENNLVITDEVDERYSVEKSTEAACRFFMKAKAQFGSWTLAAAAFNMGTVALQSQVDKQGERNFYDLLLNDETFRYLFRILAIKEIMEHTTAYGFQLGKKELYAPFQYSTVTVEGTVVDWATWAHSHQTNYKNLKLLNPWLRQNTLAVSPGKKYAIKILKKGFTGIPE
ncbi:MAG: lytic transglycosylase domain-containing protein [Bacteroidota bacterium]